MRNIKYNNIEKEILEQATKSSNTLREIIVTLGRNESSASYKSIQRRLKFYNIDSSHLLNRSQILKLKHSTKKKPNRELFVENSKSTRASVKSRIIKESLIPYKCQKCENVGEWIGIKISLILDHINGLSRDNRIENLRFLCPNCNSTLETHCVGSKGLK